MRIRAGWWTHWSTAWGESAAEILVANNEHPPMVLRVDPRQMHAEDFLRSWRAMGREARAVEWNAEAVVLERPVAVQILPGFESGSGVGTGRRRATRRAAARGAARHAGARRLRGARRQDTAYRAAHARARRADRRRRRCRAPRPRSRKSRARAARCGAAGCRPAHCARRPSARDSFDRVLVDAPCSATGVIRRHPDIKLLRRPSDIESFVGDPAENSRHRFRTTEGRADVSPTAPAR